MLLFYYYRCTSVLLISKGARKAPENPQRNLQVGSCSRTRNYQEQNQHKGPLQNFKLGLSATNQLYCGHSDRNAVLPIRWRTDRHITVDDDNKFSWQWRRLLFIAQPPANRKPQSSSKSVPSLKKPATCTSHFLLLPGKYGHFTAIIANIRIGSDVHLYCLPLHCNAKNRILELYRYVGISPLTIQRCETPRSKSTWRMNKLCTLQFKYSTTGNVT